MDGTSLEQIPIDMKTQLGNMLAQQKKNKIVDYYFIRYIEKNLSKKFPQTRTCICEVNITIAGQEPHEIRFESEAFCKKSDAERQAAYFCYQQIIYDLNKLTPKKEYSYNEVDTHRSLVRDRTIKSYSSQSSIEDYSDSETYSKNTRTIQTSLPIYPLMPVLEPPVNCLFHVYILVDVENKPNDSIITKTVEKYINVTIIRFVGKNHPNRKKGNIIVDSNYKDAADHAITMYAGGLIQSVKIPFDIIIYTGDRFGSALQEFCKFKQIKVYHMAHQDDIVDHLGTFNTVQIDGLKMLVLN